MDEPTAWLYQARADWKAAERFEVGTDRCHAIAKWQQTVEKAVKALVSGLHDAQILGAGVVHVHEVERYLGALIRLPLDAANQTIRRKRSGLLDQSTRAGIRVLDGLAPQRVTRRNTEYPFRDALGQWTYPAAEDVFSPDEVQQFRALAHRVLDGAERIVSAIRRRPR